MQPLLLARSGYGMLSKWAGPAVLSVILLLMRIIWGWQFFVAGKGKLTHIDKPIALFAELGIPAPTLNAYFVSSLECFGGLLLIIGLGSRIIGLLLSGNMVVAYLTAHKASLTPLFQEGDPYNFSEQLPFWFLTTSLLVLCFGPGWFSVDGFLAFIFRPRAAGAQRGFDVLASNPAAGHKT